MSLFRDNIDAMLPYIPGEQPAGGETFVKLNTNENPYPPSPQAIDILRKMEADSLRRYPSPSAMPIQRAVCDVFDVSPERVIVGNGSDDLLTMAFRACCGGGRGVAYPTPTYVLYRTLAAIQNALVMEIPFDSNFNLPVDDLARADAALTIIASPNSPSGTNWPVETLDDLAERIGGLLIIDEAYADFAEQTAIELPSRHDNVVVFRSLSKGYSLAGLRVGFAIGCPAIISAFGKVKDSYNVCAAAAVAAAEAIRDQDHKNGNVKKVIASRAKLTANLEELGWKVWPSQANFLLTLPPHGTAEEIYRFLKNKKILIRYFNEPEIDDKLRITVGTDEQNAKLIEALKERK